MMSKVWILWEVNIQQPHGIYQKKQFEMTNEKGSIASYILVTVVCATHREFWLGNGIGKTCLWKKIYFAL